MLASKSKYEDIERFYLYLALIFFLDGLLLGYAPKSFIEIWGSGFAIGAGLGIFGAINWRSKHLNIKGNRKSMKRAFENEVKDFSLTFMVLITFAFALVKFEALERLGNGDLALIAGTALAFATIRFFNRKSRGVV